MRIDRGSSSEPDHRKASTPHVVWLEDGSLRMYYSGSGILSARSFDGLNWVKEPGIRVPVGIPGQLSDVAHPFVLHLPSGGYRMYYECSSDERFVDVRSAVSPNGIHWMIEDGIRLSHESERGNTGGVCDPFVVETDGGLRMYYVDYDGINARILSAFSTDGLQWRREGGIRVDIGAPGSADELGASHFDIIRLPDGRLQMYYAGGSKELFGDSILTAASGDGLIWVKESGVRLAVGAPGSLDESLVLQPSIVQLPDGRFRMYYAGHSETFRILSAVAEPAFIVVAVSPMRDTLLDPEGTEAERVIPLAVLSAPGFDAAAYVERSSLTFGRTGDEGTLVACDSNAIDVNSDGLADLVCRFDLARADLPAGEVQGVLKGKSSRGAPLAGACSLRIRSQSTPKLVGAVQRSLYLLVRSPTIH